MLARAQGDDIAYRDYRDRYRDMATSLGFEGHMKFGRGDAMTAAVPSGVVTFGRTSFDRPDGTVEEEG